jgi:hypothetical protein
VLPSSNGISPSWMEGEVSVEVASTVKAVLRVKEKKKIGERIRHYQVEREAWFIKPWYIVISKRATLNHTKGSFLSHDIRVLATYYLGVHLSNVGLV